MTMNDSGPPKPERRWCQFSLRALLVFVAVAGVGFGWLGVALQRVRRSRAAAAEIQRAVAELRSLGVRVDVAQIHANGRLDRLLGHPGYPHVTAVDADNVSTFGDDDMVHLERLRLSDPEFGHLRLYVLRLEDTSVTDAGLEHVKGLTGLTRLDLDGTGVTDAGLEHLKGLTSLGQLDLAATQITGSGLEYLKGLSSLASLDLLRTQVKGPGLEYLSGLPKLRRLDLRFTPVTDTGMEHLGGLTSLEWLNLDCCKRVAGTGLEHLKGLSDLKYLNLGGTGVTDADLQHLKGLANLRELDLDWTPRVTSEGVKKLQEALPKCKIEH